MPGAAYYNGEFSNYEDIKIPLSDRSIFFGDAVYDVMIGRKGRVYQFDEHIGRLRGGARALDMSLSASPSEISDIVERLIENYADEEFLLYVQLSRKSQRREHIYAINSETNLLLFVDTISIRDSLVPISLITQDDLRYQYCNIKTVNLLPSVLASARAKELGADECVFLRDGVVTECSRSNVLFIKNDVLYAPRESRHVLPGITMSNVFGVCAEIGIPVCRCDFGYAQLVDADEVLVTSTTKLARRAYKINGIPVGMKKPCLAHLICDNLLSKFTNNDC